ncbi:GntR family transcriptional regulator [Rathayibacter sp. YIM 133350]|uniref:GntR family transcriptional regulator n=1 Tax=Rathayibacter sp. YIM 133350 TaxID=3131992 RepID=UPI00307D7C9E
MDDSRPIFLQVAESIENDIIDGSLEVGAQIPSTNEFAAFHRINPATALKGVTLLVDEGIVEKRRGIGMFVAPGARERLLQQRRDRFADQYVRPLLTEASKLGISPAELRGMIAQEATES